MFVKAIEAVNSFTRPIHSITRTYGGLISPGTSTLFFVNENGVAVTCKHVLNQITQADVIDASFQHFKAERDKLIRDGKFKNNLRILEAKYKLKKETIVSLKNNFVNSVSPLNDITYFAHPTLDLAILQFNGFAVKHYTSHATFVKDESKIKQGKYLCRLGYPFPEFNNFQYNEVTDDTEWNNDGISSTPNFPIDGIITRHISDGQQTVGIELSTPGLKGQSGGPLFDTEGLVYGMQSATNYLHLGFDIKGREVVADGKKEKVSNFPFLHVANKAYTRMHARTHTFSLCRSLMLYLSFLFLFHTHTHTHIYKQMLTFKTNFSYFSSENFSFGI
jgi:hypothetical protein